jgi:hypothetical protein
MSAQEQSQQDPDGIFQQDERAEVNTGDQGTMDTSAPSNGASMNEPLLSADDGEGFKQRWEQIQVRFVDEPQASVKEADDLVQELMQRLADNFAQERSRLDQQWERGEEASTEDLRTALQQYRSFFRRLLVA